MHFLQYYIVRPAKSGGKNAVLTREIVASAVSNPSGITKHYSSSIGSEKHYIVEISQSGQIGTSKYRWFNSINEGDILWQDVTQRWTPNPQVVDENLGLGNGLNTVFTTLASKNILDQGDAITTDITLVKTHLIQLQTDSAIVFPISRTFTVTKSTEDIPICFGSLHAAPTLSVPIETSDFNLEGLFGATWKTIPPAYVSSIDGESGVITFVDNATWSTNLPTQVRVTYYFANEATITAVNGTSGQITLSAAPTALQRVLASYRTYSNQRWTASNINTHTSYSSLDSAAKIKFTDNGLGSSKQDYTYDAIATEWVPYIIRGPLYDFIQFIPEAADQSKISEVRATKVNGIALPSAVVLSEYDDWFYHETLDQLVFVNRDSTSIVNQTVTPNLVGMTLPAYPLYPLTVTDEYGVTRNKANNNSDSTNIIVKENSGAITLTRDSHYVVDENSGSITFIKNKNGLSTDPYTAVTIPTERSIGHTTGDVSSTGVGSDLFRIYKNGIPLFKGTDFTVNSATGLITFTAAQTGSFVFLYSYFKDFDVNSSGNITFYRYLFEGDQITSSYQYKVSITGETIFTSTAGGEAVIQISRNISKTDTLVVKRGTTTFGAAITIPATKYTIMSGSGLSAIQLAEPLVNGEKLFMSYSYIEYRTLYSDILIEMANGQTVVKTKKIPIIIETSPVAYPFVLKMTNGFKTVTVNSSLYSVDVKTGLITFTQALDDTFIPDSINAPTFTAKDKSLIAEYFYDNSPVANEIAVASATDGQPTAILAFQGLTPVGKTVFVDSVSISLIPGSRYNEDVSSQVDGINTDFQLTLFPVVAGVGLDKTTNNPANIEVRINNILQASTTYTLNGEDGVVSFTSAPATNSTLLIKYYFEENSSTKVPLVRTVEVNQSAVLAAATTYQLKGTNIATATEAYLVKGTDQIEFPGDLLTSLPVYLDPKNANPVGGCLQINNDLYEIEYANFNAGKTNLFLASTLKNDYSTFTLKSIPRIVDSIVPAYTDIKSRGTVSIPYSATQFVLSGDYRVYFLPGSIIILQDTTSLTLGSGTVREFIRVSNVSYDAAEDETTVMLLTPVSYLNGFVNSSIYFVTDPFVDQGTTRVFLQDVLYDQLVVYKSTDSLIPPTMSVVSSGSYTVDNGVITLNTPLAFKERVVTTYRAYRTVKETIGVTPNTISIIWWHLAAKAQIDELSIDYTYVAPDSFYFELMPEQRMLDMMQEEFETAQENQGAAGPGPGPFNNDNSPRSKGLSGPTYRLTDREQREFIVQRVCETFNERINAFEDLRRFRYGFKIGEDDGELTNNQIETSKTFGSRLHPTDAAVLAYLDIPGGFDEYDNENVADLPMLSSHNYLSASTITPYTTFTPLPTGTSDAGIVINGHDDENEVELAFRENALMSIENAAITSLLSLERAGPAFQNRQKLGYYLGQNSLCGLVPSNQPQYNSSGVLNNDVVFQVTQISSNQDNRKAGIIVVYFDSYTNATTWTYSARFYQSSNGSLVQDVSVNPTPVSNGTPLNLLTDMGVEITLSYAGGGSDPNSTSFYVLAMGYPHVDTGLAAPFSYSSGNNSDTATQMVLTQFVAGSAWNVEGIFDVRPFHINEGLVEVFTVEAEDIPPGGANPDYVLVKNGTSPAFTNNAPSSVRTGTSSGIQANLLDLYIDPQSSVIFVPKTLASFNDLGGNPDYAIVTFQNIRAWSAAYIDLYELRDAVYDTINLFSDHYEDIYNQITSLTTSNSGLVYDQLSREDTIIDIEPFYIVNNPAGVDAEVRKTSTQNYYTADLNPNSVGSYINFYNVYASPTGSSIFNYSHPSGIDNFITDSLLSNRATEIVSRRVLVTGSLTIRLVNLNSWQTQKINQLNGTIGTYESLLNRRYDWLNFLLNMVIGISRQRQAEEAVQDIVETSISLGGGPFGP